MHGTAVTPSQLATYYFNRYVYMHIYEYIAPEYVLGHDKITLG